MGANTIGDALVGLAQATPAAPVVDAAGVDAVGLSHFLVVGALTFGVGLMLVITRRNAVAVLMGVELLLNSAGLNFVAFAKFSPGPLSGGPVVDGQIVTLFIIVIAAAEAAVGIAIVLNIYNKLNTVEVPEARSLSG